MAVGVCGGLLSTGSQSVSAFPSHPKSWWCDGWRIHQSAVARSQSGSAFTNRPKSWGSGGRPLRSVAALAEVVVVG